MSTDRLIRAAYAYLYIGDFGQAKAAFERAAAANPEDPEPLFLASITAHRSGLYEEAERLIGLALEHDPSSQMYQTQLALVRSSAWLAAARNAYIVGRVQDARLYCQNAILVDSLNEEAHQMMIEIRQRCDVKVDVSNNEIKEN